MTLVGCVGCVERSRCELTHRVQSWVYGVELCVCEASFTLLHGAPQVSSAFTDPEVAHSLFPSELLLPSHS